MPLSSFTGLPLLPDPSDATPGLFNARYSILSQNLDELNSDTSTWLSDNTTYSSEISSRVSTFDSQYSGNIFSNLSNQVTNVRNYGATGDGSTDDTAAIQSAFDQAFSDSDNAHIHFPPGQYVVQTSAITYTTIGVGKQRLRVTGGGIHATEIIQHTADVDLFHIGSTITNIMFDMYMSDMRIGTVAGTGSALRLSRAAHFDLTRIACSSAGLYGIWLEGSLIGKLECVDCTNNTDAPFNEPQHVPTGAWFRFESNLTPTTLPPNSITMIACNAEGDSVRGVWATDGKNLTIIGGTFEGMTTDYGLFVDEFSCVNTFGLELELCLGISLTNVRAGHIDTLMGGASIELNNCYGVEVSGNMEANSDIIIDKDCRGVVVDNVATRHTDFIRNSSLDCDLRSISESTEKATQQLYKYGTVPHSYPIHLGGMDEWNADTPARWTKLGNSNVTITGDGQADVTKFQGQFASLISTTTISEGLQLALSNSFMSQWIYVEAWVNVSEGTPFLGYSSGNKILPISSTTSTWIKAQMSFYHNSENRGVWLASNSADTLDFYVGAVNIWAESKAWPESITAAAGDATPSIDLNPGYTMLRTANTSKTTITDIDDAVHGARVAVIIGDANTEVDFTGTNLKGNNSTDWVPPVGNHMDCIYDGIASLWYCDISDTS